MGDDVHRAARIAAVRPRRPGARLLLDRAARRASSSATSASTGSRTSPRPSASTSSETATFPALKSLYRTNLPVPATPFLGREQELAEVVELLGADDTRLLTLTGPGGTGKTRLALQAAGLASDAYPDGVWWIPLAPLRDPALVLATAGQTLGSKNGLAEHISDKAMLCLFDNFEQVVDAGPELAASWPTAPTWTSSSRAGSACASRASRPTPSHRSPSQTARRSSSTRARAVDPAFTPSEAVRELCLRLDELPLALELAAARTALFSPEQLLEKLSQRLDLLKGERDADPRQQTLRATIEWSYDLLSDDEQRLFRRLAVFAGGCTYEAAEEIAEADPDTLQSLLDKSLVRKRDSPLGPRYWMLETIREYARGQLEESGEAERLATVTSRTTPPSPRTSTLARQGRRVRARAARGGARQSPQRSSIPRSRSSPSGRSSSREARPLLEPARALRRAAARGRARRGSPSPAPTRCRALIWACSLAREHGDVDAAERFAQGALALAREHGDRRNAGTALGLLGSVAWLRGDLAAAEMLQEESLVEASAAGDQRALLWGRGDLALVVGATGTIPRAIAIEREVVVTARERQDITVLVPVLSNLGYHLFLSGETEDARRDAGGGRHAPRARTPPSRFARTRSRCWEHSNAWRDPRSPWSTPRGSHAPARQRSAARERCRTGRPRRNPPRTRRP